MSFVIPLSYSLTSSSSVPIAPAVVTKSATSSVDSNFLQMKHISLRIHRFHRFSILSCSLSRNNSVFSVNSVWNIPVLTLIIFSHTESTEFTDFPFWRYISGVSKLHFESTELSRGANALRRAGAVLAPIVFVALAPSVARSRRLLQR